MSEKKTLNEQQLNKVSGGECEEVQYECKKCGTIIDINTADKKVIENSDNSSAIMQYGYWCPICNEYVAVVPVGGISPIDIKAEVLL